MQPSELGIRVEQRRKETRPLSAPSGGADRRFPGRD